MTERKVKLRPFQLSLNAVVVALFSICEENFNFSFHLWLSLEIKMFANSTKQILVDKSKTASIKSLCRVKVLVN